MRSWTPDPDDPQLLDWWAPLVRASRLALAHEVPWLILVDEWDLEGRVDGSSGRHTGPTRLNGVRTRPSSPGLPCEW